MSYYVGATGEYIWEELLDNATSNVVIANNINFDAGPLTNAIQETITDALGTALGELIAPITEVPSATGVGVVALTALGLLSYYKLNRTAVKDVDSMVYSADYASTLTPGMFDDRVRIRYNTNQFSNAFYYEGGVKKGEILTSRINLLPVDSNNIDLYTSTGKIGIGTATPATPLHIYNATTANICLETGATGTASIDFQRGTINDVNVDYRIVNNTGRFSILSQDEVNLYTATTSEIIRITRTTFTNYKELYNIGNVSIGIQPDQSFPTQLRVYNSTNPIIRIETDATGTASIEFQRGAFNDANVDYRIINEGDLFKIQSQDATNLYTATTSELIRISPTQNTIYKNTIISGAKLGIGVASIGSAFDFDMLGAGRMTGGLTTGDIYSGGNVTIATGKTLTLTGTTGIVSGGHITMATGKVLTLQGTSTLIAGGLISADGGLTIATGKTLTLSGTATISAMTATGLITANAGITIPTGQTLTLAGTAGLSAQAITAQGLITANGGITLGTSSLLTANNGITIPAGKTLTANGGLTANGTIIRLTGVVADNVKTDLEIMANSLTTPYSIKFVQHRITSTDFRYYLTQTNLGTEYTNPSLSFKVGNVGIGTNNPINILQVGGGGRLRIANNNTDYTMIGVDDVDGVSNTRIICDGSARSGGGSINYVATTTGVHTFYTTASTTERMTIANNGNVGIGTNNPINLLELTKTSYTGAILSVDAGVANAGAGVLPNAIGQPLLRLGRGAYSQTAGDYYGIGFGYAPSHSYNSCCEIGVKIGSIAGSTSGDILFSTRTGTTNIPASERMRITYNGAVGIQTNGYAVPNGYMSAGSLTIGNQNQNYGAGQNWNGNTAGILMECADNTEIAVHDAGNSIMSFMYYSASVFYIGRNMGYGLASVNIQGSATIGSDLFVSSSRLVLRGYSPTLYLRDIDNRSGMIHMNGNNMYFLNGSGNDSESWTQQNGQDWALRIDMNNNNAFFGGQITAYFVAVSSTDTDHVVVQLNYGSIGQGANLTLKVALYSFTAFHRCYTDDVLYNNDTQENIDLFKNNYIGRVVIATGKIKTDFTRQVEAEGDAEIDGVSGLPRDKEKIDEWYSGIDKDGISIEDAVPVVALSRKKKDKRVFGVLGLPSRRTNNKDRLIVNSVGEGGICVSNTNGNIENGDYLQSSDLLGYGEKQDDDILHNYTIGKATIDCDFQLDSLHYQCHEIENGVRVAFIACSYHCG